MSNYGYYLPFPEKPRAGCKDLWNAHLVSDAVFDAYDIPFCPTTASTIPNNLISIQKAKSLFEEEMVKGHRDFKCPAFIHPYIDDQAFDGARESFWANPEKLVKIARHFEGLITIDFSTYLDFPDPIKRWNTYRMRALGFYTGQCGIPTINNVRWGEEETWSYCFSGLPKHSIYAIGTVASKVRQLGYRDLLSRGLDYMVEKLEPQTFLLIGSDKHPKFDELRKRGIRIITFESDTAKYYERRKK